MTNENPKPTQAQIEATYRKAKSLFQVYVKASRFGACKEYWEARRQWVKAHAAAMKFEARTNGDSSIYDAKVKG